MEAINTMNDQIKIMLVEDNQEYSEVIKLAISRRDGMELTAAFTTAEIALRSLRSEEYISPHIILLDLRLPGMGGLEALPYFKEMTPEAKIIILSQSDAESDISEAISKGASGYLLKSSTIAQIKDGIRAVAEGGVILDPTVAKFVLQEYKSNRPILSVNKALSNRELEVLGLLAEGKVKKEIGDTLSISYGTVDTHIRRVYQKLDVNNAAGAVSMAFRMGILLASEE